MRTWVCLVALLLVGCDADTHLLVIDVRTDYLAGEEFAEIVVRVAPDGDAPTEARFDDLRARFDEGVRVAELEVRGASAIVEAELRDAAGDVLVARPVLVDLSTDQAATIVLSRRCEGVSCGDDEACALGRCVSTRCVEESPAECGERECDVAADCAGGSPCAAAECTASGGCFYVPDDAACSARERCHPVRGCEPAGGPSDAGSPDAGALDAGPSCPESPCRLVAPQCGCAPGQACQTSGGDLICGPGGSLGDSEVCTGGGQCAPGLACVRRGDRPEGACRPYCRSATDCASARCGSLGGNPFGACASACDPIGQTGCAAGHGCHAVLASRIPLDGTPILVTHCSTDSGLPTGSACDASADCSPGDACTPMGCLALCDVDGAPCASGTCTLLMDDITLPGGGRPGVCVLSSS